MRAWVIAHGFSLFYFIVNRPWARALGINVYYDIRIKVQ